MVVSIMKIYEHYLRYLQENKHITKYSKAPCAAYEAVYEKKCPHKSGRFPGQHKQKTWNGILVDEHLKNKWLNDLNNIKGIEIRSSCEGHNKDWLTFIIFRFTNNKSKDPKIIESKLESDNITKSSAHIGQAGKLRIVVAAKLWYGQAGWEKWWNTLTNKIKELL